MEAPEFYMGGFYGAGVTQFSPEKRMADQKMGENFAVEDLLDFPNEDAVMTDCFFDNINANSTDSSTVTVVDSCNSSRSGSDAPFSGNLGNRNLVDPQFSGDLCVPYDDMAELEWLSNFVEDQFSTEELQNLHLITGAGAGKPLTPESSSSENHSQTPRNNTIFSPETPLPGKARSKRSRAAPCNWSTRLLHVPSPSTGNKTTPSKKKENSNSDAVLRKCLHCATEKTPQWRTGPMGPKTLCNACGVRYKSGRLVPEYRPAASPTFVSTKHSNSHRKVMELRRQKELARHQQQQLLSQSSVFGLSNGGDDYMVHHHPGSDYRHMI